MISSRFPSTKSSYQYSIRVYLGQLKKRLITIICVTETKRKFPSKKVWTSTTFEYLKQILIKAKRSQNRSKSFQRWVRNGEEKKKRTRGRTVAANTDLCHCARFISVRHSTSHIFEPHRIFQTRINRISLSAYHKRNHQCSIFPYFSTTIRRIIYSTC